MSLTGPVISLAWCLLCIHEAGSAELCYTDSSTGAGVYCDPHCCGSSPVYCCDKTPFVVQNAVCGALGAIFIVCFAVCCYCKKRTRTKKKRAKAKEAARKDAKRPAVTDASGSMGVVNQGFDPGQTGPSRAASASHLSSTGAHDSRSQSIPMEGLAPDDMSTVSPPPYEDPRASPAPPANVMYADRSYPEPVSPALPAPST